MGISQYAFNISTDSKSSYYVALDFYFFGPGFLQIMNKEKI